jgi:uncharacterized protein YbjT (DUF2867 family)
MILVLGATGTTGGEVARQLIQAGQKPRLLVLNPSKARAFEGKAEIVRGDLGNPESLMAAMQGIAGLYLMSPAASDPELEGNAIDAAKKAGVKHVVKLSVIGADAPIVMFSKWHARSEALLRESGLAWTMLRPQTFMTYALEWAQTIRSQGAFYLPTGEGRWAAIDPADIGAVAVKALTEPGHEHQAYTLTGPESLSAAQYAVKLSVAIGKPVKFVDVPPEAARQGMLQKGIPTVLVDALMELLAVTKAGKLDAVSDGVYKAIGRKPATFDDWAKRNAAAFL